LSHRYRVAVLPIETCAAVRGLISPVQPGRTRKEVLESPCLPGAERRRETQHAWKAIVCVKTLMQSCRKIRTPRLKLDCGARPIARRANGRPTDTTSDIGALLYCRMRLGQQYLPQERRASTRRLKVMKRQPTVCSHVSG